jgi:hypothetical protein
MRPAAAIAVLLACAAAPQFACKRARELGEHRMAATTLADLCIAYTEAAKKTSDPEIAYKDVKHHFFTIWPPLIKMRAGVEGLWTGGRYPFWLRFARHDYNVEWTCPALDRLLLESIDRQEVKPDGKRYPIVRVAASGEVSIDGDAVALADLKESLARLYERDHIANFYREGWATRMPPNSDTVLALLVDQQFTVSICAKPDCPDLINPPAE